MKVPRPVILRPLSKGKLPALVNARAHPVAQADIVRPRVRVHQSNKDMSGESFDLMRGAAQENRAAVKGRLGESVEAKVMSQLRRQRTFS